MPSRPHVTTTCQIIYSNLKEELKGTLVSRDVAITTDLWTSRATESYINISAHFSDEEWNLQDKFLLTHEMPERHTAKHIAERLQESVKNFNIDERNISAIVQDNARNIKLAVQKLGWQDVPCFVHTLQLGVNSGLDSSQISRLIAVE